DDHLIDDYGVYNKECTGLIVMLLASETMKDAKIENYGARVAIQGSGNVAGTAVQLFHEHGAKVIAIQDHTGVIYQSNGLDIPKVLQHVEETGGVAGFAPADTLTHDEFWALETEVLIPAALEEQITADNANQIRTKILVEGANGPTTPKADDMLTQNGVIIVPDVIANAGGVSVSYFEWVQNFSSFFWTIEEINKR